MWIQQIRRTRRVILTQKKDHPLMAVSCLGIFALTITAAASGGIGAGLSVFFLGVLILGITGILK